MECYTFKSNLLKKPNINISTYIPFLSKIIPDSAPTGPIIMGDIKKKRLKFKSFLFLKTQRMF